MKNEQTANPLGEAYQQGYDNMKEAYYVKESHNYTLDLVNRVLRENPKLSGGEAIDKVKLTIAKEKTAGAFGKTIGLINDKHQLYVSSTQNIIRQLENRIKSMKKDVTAERTFLDEQITQMDSYLISKGLLGEYMEYLKQ